MQEEPGVPDRTTPFYRSIGVEARLDCHAARQHAERGRARTAAPAHPGGAPVLQLDLGQQLPGTQIG